MKKQKVTLQLVIAMSLIICFIYSCKKYDKLLAVESGNVSNINATGAEINALVIDVGESGVTEHGWCISTNPNPTINDYMINNGIKEDYGSYTNIITGLNPTTKY